MIKLLISIIFTFLISTSPGVAKVVVVTSFSVLNDLVQNIGGPLVDSHTIVGPNSDAHIYQPTPQAAKLISNADLVIVNGLGFEGWIDRLIRASGYKKKIVVASQNIANKKFPKESSKIVQDPHAWHSVPNVIEYVKTISAALVAHDPANKDQYQANAQRYIRKLKKLDTWVRDQFKKLPKSKRKIISAHDAFQYFGHEYKIKFIAPVGVSTEAEASALDIVQLITQIRREKIKAVFVENSSNPRLIEEIASQTGAFIGGILYADALSYSNGPAPTYIKMIHHNVMTIILALNQ